jgi:hypothetical protein
VADAAAVDEALIAALRADTGVGSLAALMTGGVYMDVAPVGKDKFVLVSLVTHEDRYLLGGTAFERSLYLIKAVEKGTAGTNATAAASRIHTLMQGISLVVPGYQYMLTQREERVRYTEVDEIDPATKWQHRGGRYAVLVSP